MDGDDESLPFSQDLRNTHVPNHFVLPKIPKYEGKGDPVKHLNNYKTYMSLRGALPTLKCKAFNLTLVGVAEIWYGRLPTGSIKSWLDLKKAFLNQYLASKEGEAPIQRLQDIRQQAGETPKSYLTRFTDEMTYCAQVTDREALLALKRGLNINTFFWTDVWNRNPNSTINYALVEMMRSEIVREKPIDHRNRTSLGLLPP